MPPAAGTARPDLSVVMVHYRAGRLAAEAFASVLADLWAAGFAAELLLVDNGSDAEDRERLAELPVRRLEPGDNLGYAGGVNLGVAEARGETLVLMNPDVEVLPGCLPALLAALAGGAEIAGPRFYWDRGRRLLLPPAEARGRLDELLAALAGRGGRWAALARRRWRRHARRHWTAEGALASHALSGALLAFRRRAWERLGPFDTGYRLYFEETDWLARAARARLPSRYVPAAQAVHAHGQSARRQPDAAAWFAESAHRFRARHLGRGFTALLERSAGRPRAAGEVIPQVATGVFHESADPDAGPDRGLDLGRWREERPLWVEVSPRREGFPAAAERLAATAPGRWTLPAEVVARDPGPLSVRLTGGGGRELACFGLLPAATLGSVPRPELPAEALAGAGGR